MAFKDKRPPEELTQRQLWFRIVRRNKLTIAELEQIIRDVMWWNKHRTECEPMDCEAERVMLADQKKQLAEFLRLNPEPPA